MLANHCPVLERLVEGFVEAPNNTRMPFNAFHESLGSKLCTHRTANQNCWSLGTFR